MLPLAGEAFRRRVREAPPPTREARVFPGISAKTADALHRNGEKLPGTRCRPGSSSYSR